MSGYRSFGQLSRFISPLVGTTLCWNQRRAIDLLFRVAHWVTCSYAQMDFHCNATCVYQFRWIKHFSTFFNNENYTFFNIVLNYLLITVVYLSINNRMCENLVDCVLTVENHRKPFRDRWLAIGNQLEVQLHEQHTSSDYSSIQCRSN